MKAPYAAAGAVALLIGGIPAVATGAPPTCAEVLKKIEKKMIEAGIAQPQLKIVPKNLAPGSDVVASCENGTQRIVRRPNAAASTPASGTRSHR